MNNNLYIIIPAYNEEANIGNVVNEWHAVVDEIGNGSKLVVIDDGSKDSTYQILTALQKQYPSLLAIRKTNEGHGATLLYGYKYALSQKADYIFQTDSDGQTLPEEFRQFWKKRYEFDAVIGYRNHRKDGFSRIIVTKTLKLVLRIIFGLNVTDANTPYRLMSYTILQKYLPLVPEKFNLSNVMLTVLFLHNNEKVTFIPITFRPRQGGINSINIKKIFKIGLQAVKDFRIIKKEMEAPENVDRKK